MQFGCKGTKKNPYTQVYGPIFHFFLHFEHKQTQKQQQLLTAAAF